MPERTFAAVALSNAGLNGVPFDQDVSFGEFSAAGQGQGTGDADEGEDKVLD